MFSSVRSDVRDILEKLAVERPLVEFLVGDVTVQDVDTLITASGLGPRGQSQVELAVRRRAGPALEVAYETLRAARTSEHDAEPIVTDGFALKSKRIVHCKPPSFDEHDVRRSAIELARTVRTALERASERGARSLAIASLGTGAYGFPAHVAAPTTVAEIVGFVARERQAHAVRIVVTNPTVLRTYIEASMRVLPRFVPRARKHGGLAIEVDRDTRE